MQAVKKIVASILIAIFALMLIAASAAKMPPGRSTAELIGQLIGYVLILLGLFFSTRWRLTLAGRRYKVGRQAFATLWFCESILGILLGFSFTSGVEVRFGVLMVVVWSLSLWATYLWLKRLRGHEVESPVQTGHTALTSVEQAGGIENKADKPTLTEQEAAGIFVGSVFRNTQYAWPAVHNNLREFRERFIILGDESTAAFNLGLAAISLDLQAVKNLFPVEQADRIENLVLMWVFAHGNERGGYAVDEVKKYGAMFQKESRFGAELALGAIPGRLLHRWLGEGIKNFEPEIRGEKSGFIDVMLIVQTTNALIAFSGIWKALADKYKLVEGAPKYTLTTTKIWQNLEKTDQIMSDQSLTEAQRAAAIKALSEDYERG